MVVVAVAMDSRGEGWGRETTDEEQKRGVGKLQSVLGAQALSINTWGNVFEDSSPPFSILPVYRIKVSISIVSHNAFGRRIVEHREKLAECFRLGRRLPTERIRSMSMHLEGWWFATRFFCSSNTRCFPCTKRNSFYVKVFPICGRWFNEKFLQMFTVHGIWGWFLTSSVVGFYTYWYRFFFSMTQRATEFFFHLHLLWTPSMFPTFHRGFPAFAKNVVFLSIVRLKKISSSDCKLVEGSKSCRNV